MKWLNGVGEVGVKAQVTPVKAMNPCTLHIYISFFVQWYKTCLSALECWQFLQGCSYFEVDTESGKQWRYSELRGWIEMCADRMREIGVNTSSRVAVITSTTGQALFVHFACSVVGAVAVCINAFLTVGTTIYTTHNLLDGETLEDVQIQSLTAIQMTIFQHNFVYLFIQQQVYSLFKFHWIEILLSLTWKCSCFFFSELHLSIFAPISRS